MILDYLISNISTSLLHQHLFNACIPVTNRLLSFLWNFYSFSLLSFLVFLLLLQVASFNSSFCYKLKVFSERPLYFLIDCFNYIKTNKLALWYDSFGILLKHTCTSVISGGGVLEPFSEYLYVYFRIYFLCQHFF